MNRETLGRRVREVWVAWAREQSDAKDDWLVPWEELDTRFQEVDCRIGTALWADFINEYSHAIADHVMKCELEESR